MNFNYFNISEYRSSFESEYSDNIRDPFEIAENRIIKILFKFVFIISKNVQ